MREFQADWDKWIDEDEEEKKPAEAWNPDNMNGIFCNDRTSIDINPGEFKSDSDDDAEAKGILAGKNTQPIQEIWIKKKRSLLKKQKLKQK